MLNILIVALGGALGTVGRHLVNVAAARLAGTSFPYGTVFVNLSGSFLMGILVAMLARRAELSPELRLFLATGVLGGFTTFSAFSLDFAVLWQRDAVALALLYAFASVLGAIAALFFGMWVARWLA